MAIRRLEIDLPIFYKLDETDVVCRKKEDYAPRIAAWMLYELIESMPVTTLTELVRNPEFRKLYERIKGSIDENSQETL